MCIYICGSIFVYYKRALLVCGCMRTLCVQPYMGGLKNGKNGGEPNRFCLVFVVMEKEVLVILRIVAPLSLIGFGSFSLLIPPCLFTVHVRPVLSPYQAGNTCCIFRICFKFVYNIYNIIDIICTRNMYTIMFSTAIYVRDHRILLDLYIIS